MAWIKRNLYFVISAVVGLGLTGFCGYLFYSSMSENAAAKEAYESARSGLDTLQKKAPFPSKENIEAAEADKVRVQAFLNEFRKPFSGYPTPPKLDDRQFKDYLQKIVYQFGTDATNAGVGLSPGYAFTFSQQIDKLNFPSESIGPWLQDLEEIKALLRIFYKAKINYLESLKRPTGGGDDLGPDVSNILPTTNSFGIVSPYVITFRAFSAEIADVLTGLAASSNCYIVQALFVEPSHVALPPPSDLLVVPQTQPQTQQVFPSPYTRRRPENPSMDPSDRSDSTREPYGRRRFGPLQPVPVEPTPVLPSAPVIVLTERPLFVTMYVNVVKLKVPEPPAPAAASAPARGPGRPPRTLPATP
jgi:hypothetical protein